MLLAARGSAKIKSEVNIQPEASIKLKNTASAPCNMAPPPISRNPLMRKDVNTTTKLNVGASCVPAPQSNQPVLKVPPQNIVLSTKNLTSNVATLYSDQDRFCSPDVKRQKLDSG